jgi:MFS family permease
MKKGVKKTISKRVESKPNKKIQKSLDNSIKSGAAYGVTDGTVNVYVAPYAVAMGASNNEIAMLSSIPNLVAPLSELGTTKAMQKFTSRKTIVVTSVLLQSLVLIPMMLIPFLFLKGDAARALVVIYSIYAIFGTFLVPAYNSWMGDLVAEKNRGWFFGNKSKITGFVSLAVSLGASFFLDIFPKQVFTGFVILMIIGFIARILSAYYHVKMYEPKLVLKEKFQFSFIDFIKKMPFNNFGRFVIYISLINFAVYLAAPFFTVYQLRSLNLSYVQYTLLIIVSGVTTIIALPLWGKFADKYGTIRTLKITGFLIPIVPLLWVFSADYYYLLVIQIFNGIAWSGFNLSSANFLFDSTTVQRRSSCDAYSAIVYGVSIFLGAGLGGYLATNLKINFMNLFLFIFFVSFILRLLISFLVLPSVKEVREVKKTPLMEIIGLSHKGLSHRVIGWQFKNKKK